MYRCNRLELSTRQPPDLLWESKIKSHVILRYRFPESTLSTSIQDRTEPPGIKKKDTKSWRRKELDLKREGKRWRYI